MKLAFLISAHKDARHLRALVNSLPADSEFYIHIDQKSDIRRFEEKLDQENIHFTFKCSFVNELKVDQSISHNGVCLTVVSMTDDTYTVTAMKETLERSNLGLLKVGDKVNVEIGRAHV